MRKEYQPVLMVTLDIERLVLVVRVEEVAEISGAKSSKVTAHLVPTVQTVP